MVGIPLSSLRPRERGRVLSILGGWGAARRLMELGLVPGEVVEVVSNSYGPIVVRVRGSSFALGRGLASKVIVEVID